jgi:hypothetical protein
MAGLYIKMDAWPCIKKSKNIEKSTHGKIRYSEIDNREKKAENSIDR